MRPILSACLFTALIAGQAAAQSSIGITGAAIAAESSGQSTTLSAAADVAITGYHGMQIGLGLTDDGTAPRGWISGHLYLMPGDGSRYGLFASLFDLDGAPRNYAEIGVEAGFDLSDRLWLSGAAAMGAASFDELDWIALRSAADYRISDRLSASVSASVTEFEEAAFSADLVALAARLDYRPGRLAPGLYLQLSADQLFGYDAAPMQTSLSVGVSFGLGQAPHWREADPLRALFRRGLL